MASRCRSDLYYNYVYDVPALAHYCVWVWHKDHLCLVCLELAWNFPSCFSVVVNVAWFFCFSYTSSSMVFFSFLACILSWSTCTLRTSFQVALRDDQFSKSCCWKSKPQSYPNFSAGSHLAQLLGGLYCKIAGFNLPRLKALKLLNSISPNLNTG